MRDSSRSVPASLLLTSLLGWASATHAAPSPGAPPAAVATINGKPITVDFFSRKFSESSRMFSFSAPTREGVLDDMIKRELGIQEARRLGLENDPDVQERMQNVLYQSLLEKQLAKEFESITITDEMAKSFYDQYPEIRSSHIFLGLRPDAPKAEVDAAYARMKTIQDVHLKDPSKGFAEVAQRFSEGVAAPMGGDIDYQTKDRPDPTYYAAALALKTPGKVSGIVRTQHGLHLIKLTAVRPWSSVDRAKIKRIVFEEKRQQVFEKYMANLRKKSKITIHSDILGTVR